MEKTTKITKTMILTAIEGYFYGDGQGYDPDEVLLTTEKGDVTAADVLDYCAKVKEQLATKAVKAKEYAAKKKVESDELKAKVAEALTELPQTRDDILVAIDADETVTVAKVGARLTALVKDGVAVKEEIKTVTGRKMGYKLA